VAPGAKRKDEYVAETAEAPPSGVVETLSPGLRRLVAPNPSPFTQTGTCTYIVGDGEVAILDPGPDDDGHLARLLAAVAGERVAYVVVTHTHGDHSALSGRLTTATGAELVGARPHIPRPGAPQGLDAAHDLSYAPSRALADGESVDFGGQRLTALATPGHAGNHLCFVWDRTLFSGDHVMAWSTTVVAPPDGVMADYMASLEKLRDREETVYWPGHGGPVRDPKRYVRGLISHRRQREAAILARLEAGPATIAEIVEKNYAGLAPRLKGAAALSTLAHLEDLLARGLATRGPGKPLEAVYARG
jgi:glyoxylase-like metal-dependent hydrolase (beta-lactamase superfamily II)